MMERNALNLKERWCRYLEEYERFWRVCLEVARSKPHLCAEEVEAEAVDIMMASRAGPAQVIQYDYHTFLSLVLGRSVAEIIYNYLESRHNIGRDDVPFRKEEFQIIMRQIMGNPIASILEWKLIST